MKSWRIGRRAALAMAAGVVLSTAGPGLAAGFPDRAVTLVVPFAAGGSTDVVARLAGAGGSLGAGRVARAEPDGHTILMGTVATHALNPLILASKPYDPQTDFAPVSLLAVVPNVLVVNPALPATTVGELVAMLKAEPGKHEYASSGVGTPLHLSGELFKAMAGVDMTHVPYKGSGPALTDLLGNQVSIMFDNLPSSSGHIASGSLRALAVTTATRAPSLPDTPTVAETLPGYETYTWNALFAPAGTPEDAVARLNAAAVKALAEPAVLAKLAEFSASPVGSTPAALAAHVAAEMAKWGPIVAAAGVKVE
jgi:tripartite-type tricarboxylate transporter receptor subunit TctC